MSLVDGRIRALSLEIPPVPKPAGNYAPLVRSGRLLFLSGAIGTAFQDGHWSLPIKGKLGVELTVEQGYASARYCALNHIAVLQDHLKALSRVKQIVKLVGYVNSGPAFTKAPLVLDGASDLLIAVFGPDCGLHARSAVYQPEMSFNAPVETDLVVEIED